MTCLQAACAGCSFPFLNFIVMEATKKVLVTGITGWRGKVFAASLLAQPGFEVRIYTRHPTATSILALGCAGAEIRTGDPDHIESLRLAMIDVDAVVSLSRHTSLALLEAAGQARVPHLVLQAGETAEQYAASRDLPVTWLKPVLYYEQLLPHISANATGNGTVRIALPQGNLLLAAFAAADLGAVVAAVLQHAGLYKGRKLAPVGQNSPCREYAAILSEELGIDLRCHEVPQERLGLTVKDGDSRVDMIETYALHPQALSFRQWVRANRYRIQTALQQGLQAV